MGQTSDVADKSDNAEFVCQVGQLDLRNAPTFVECRADAQRKPWRRDERVGVGCHTLARPLTMSATGIMTSAHSSRLISSGQSCSHPTAKMVLLRT
jgi:hypothetical protein